jgi:hypothetical protein
MESKTGGHLRLKEVIFIIIPGDINTARYFQYNTMKTTPVIVAKVFFLGNLLCLLAANLTA